MPVTIQDITKPTVTVGGTIVHERETKVSDTIFKVEDPNLVRYRFTGPVEVIITAEGTDKVTFTLDGRRPTRHSTLYLLPFNLYGNTSGCDNVVLKCRAWRSDGTSSPTAKFEFTVGRLVETTHRDDTMFQSSTTTRDTTELNSNPPGY